MCFNDLSHPASSESKQIQHTPMKNRLTCCDWFMKNIFKIFRPNLEILKIFTKPHVAQRSKSSGKQGPFQVKHYKGQRQPEGDEVKPGAVILG